MEPQLVLRYAQDRNFDRLLSEALFGTRTRAARARGAIVLITET
jgi:hypothetical protein